MNRKNLYFVIIIHAVFFLICEVSFSFEKTVTPTNSPSATYQSIMSNPNLTQYEGESWCWHAAYSIHTFVDGYEATHNTQWLDYGVQYYDYIVEQMKTGPDGYKGWIGPYIYDNNYWCDVHVGDAILLRGMLRFSVLVLSDSTLKPAYESKADSYIQIAKKDFVEKWDARGTWEEDGPFGCYVSDDAYMAPNDYSEWRYGSEVTKSNLSLPFNKQTDCAVVCLYIYRATGEQFYRDKAEMIFYTMKSRFQYFDSHYVWNYWEPLGDWDIDSQTNLPRHWVNVHPYRNYQAGEVDDIVIAYHAGMVFDSLDVQRIINTNMEIMWNKDSNNPAFSNANITHTPPSYDNDGNTAGTLWTALADFNQTVRDLYYKIHFEGASTISVARAYYENVTLSKQPGFARKYTDDTVSVTGFNHTECSEINMAAVFPSIIERGKESVIINKSWTSGNLEIALYSGDEKKKVLYDSYIQGGSDGLGGIFIMKWGGKDPDGVETYSGDYKIRWTFGNEYREFPVSIIAPTDIEIADDISVPKSYDILQNYPNPFNPETTIEFSVPRATKVTLTVYNTLGQKIKTLVNDVKSAGNYVIRWDGTNENGHKVCSGVYIYKLSTNAGYTKSRKMVFLK